MATNVTVKQRAGESSDRMIKRFLKQVKKFRIVEQVRDSRFYQKKSDIKRLAKQKARREMDKKNAKKSAKSGQNQLKKTENTPKTTKNPRKRTKNENPKCNLALRESEPCHTGSC